MDIAKIFIRTVFQFFSIRKAENGRQAATRCVKNSKGRLKT
ncbi:hypothetical protein HMPREF3156_02664 [Neisseria sp. HMSC06F02]|nr:hypothetical protein HMPREF3156_02664 [Neisseria sp. HMSC06F02]